MSDRITQALIVTYILLACCSGAERQYAKTVYWLGAAVVTLGVLMMKG